MTAFWIHRKDGIVRGSIVAAFARPEDLADWRFRGLEPELVSVPSGTIAVPAPLPDDAVVIEAA